MHKTQKKKKLSQTIHSKPCMWTFHNNNKSNYVTAYMFCAVDCGKSVETIQYTFVFL